MIHFTDDEFKRLRDYIISQYGIDLTKKRILAECRMSNELEKQGIASMGEFLDRMESDRTDQLRSMLLNRLTTNYTYFMREPAHYEYLERTILPELGRDRKKSSFHIWSAGCSTGEESYTIVMMLKNFERTGGWLPPYSVKGTDISERAVNLAKAGRYPVSELEHIPEAWRQSYTAVEPDGRHFTVSPGVKEKAEFLCMNLLKPYGGIGEYDLIFCRNVMIYFDEESRKKLLEALYRALKPDGRLFVGHTELLPRNHQLFEYICPAVYKKRTGAYG